MSIFLRRSSTLLLRDKSVRFACKVSSTDDLSCKVLVLGATTGGLAVTHRLARHLSMNELVLIDSAKYHYYKQHMCLVGVGDKSLDSVRAEIRTLIPNNVTWMTANPESAQVSSDGSSIKITTIEKRTITCKYLVIAIDREYIVNDIPGLEEALSDPHSGVCTAYHPMYAQNAWSTIRSFKGGNAIFADNCHCHEKAKSFGSWADSMPYLANSYFKRVGIRSKTNMTYFTHFGYINDIETYNEALKEVMKKENISYSSRQLMKSVNPKSKEVVFNDKTHSYDLLHVSKYVRALPEHANLFLQENVWDLDVNMETLQHNKYPNVYGIGECLSFFYKTDFSMGIQSGVLVQNLLSAMDNKPLKAKYDGYRLIPYMTSDGTCMLAEWIGIETKDYKIRQTFRCNQAKPSQFAHYLNRYLIPHVYWNYIIKGKYNGQDWLRKILHPFGR